jgi:thymidylate kinase
MKILIIEGIATSGKSSLIERISNLLGKDNVKVYGESDTHIPIMGKTDDLHTEFFKSLLEDATRSNAKLIIFDRFHFTQAFRAKANVVKYFEVEDLLAEQTTLVVYLLVDEDAIANRVKLAAEHREESWGEYVRTKGKSFEEIAKHYADQQSSQLQLLDQSKLEKRIFNTTNHDYRAVANQIINEWFNKA